ncbi:MAG: biopolymer transporter ExbD [Alphaproteobacteria bacterium]|nr:MAG: biopolymer transporter ExbD [Alphaproteobacteria bacterium]
MARKRIQAEGAEVDLTPMLDIVFIMLIFFIVTATFIKEPGLDVDRPTAEESDPVKTISALVAVGPRNEIYIDKREVDLRSVRATVERLLLENPGGGVVIQADKDAEMGVVIEVMDQVQLAGAPKVDISTTKD